MIKFEFILNKSFLAAGYHPITIPRGQVPHGELIGANLNHDEVTLVIPDGSRHQARLYAGVSGYGGYFQLRCTSRSGALSGNLGAGERAVVLMFTHRAGSFAVLELLAEGK